MVSTRPVIKASKKSLLSRLLGQWQIQVFALAGIIYLVIFSYLPMVGISIAFRSYKLTSGLAGVFTSKWVGLKYFEEFVTDYRFPEQKQCILRERGYRLAPLQENDNHQLQRAHKAPCHHKELLVYLVLRYRKTHFARIPEKVRRNILVLGQQDRNPNEELYVLSMVFFRCQYPCRDIFAWNRR